ncbi:MAG: twin-arginine translocation signal domain-containing protein [Candidatus Aenigmarchaeota archaeon]|nr:twin-arginine translocation signal domain-containing protein [Candidatus Aenigmarchaeota archaeon]
MSTKNPTENYLKGEQLDNQAYLSEGISRREFLKGAAGLAGAAIFGEGFLKQMEAWAEDGVSVYIDNFEVAGDLPQGLYQNVERQIPMKLATILRNKGVKVITRSDKVTDDTIIIRGTFNYKYKDPQMRTGYMDLPFDSIELNIQYEDNESLAGGKTYKRDSRMFPDPMLDEVGSDMAGYLINRRTPPRGSRLQNEKHGPDVMKMVIDGKERTVVRCAPGPNTTKILEEKDQEGLKALKRIGQIPVGKELYQIID